MVHEAEIVGRNPSDIGHDDKNSNLKRYTDLNGKDILGLEFENEDEAYEFYNNYAKFHGFDVRRSGVSRDINGDIITRTLVCNKHGLRKRKNLDRFDRKRQPKVNTRTNCRAKIKVNLDVKSQLWKVEDFVEEHNHTLTPPQFVHLHSKYRGLSQGDKAQIDSLHSFGVRTCHIMGYIASQKGGFLEIGFTNKDVYNHIDTQRRLRVKDGDANAGISYLRGKSGSDPLMFGKYTLTNDDRLANLFWRDGASLIDYHCFGDVVAFDATYKKNKYNKPLVIFSGTNHHAQTTIFGCALVADETADTYKWVLQTFLEAMGNKYPMTVVTNGDGAMKEAIKEVFPNATHRLCSWHLQKNACENVKNSSFLEDFNEAIYSNVDVDDFEMHWSQMVERHNLYDNRWVMKTYENRKMWAQAYLRDKFFGRIRTTSQCEGINSLIRAYIRKKNTIIEFMQNFDLAIRGYRNNELHSDFKSFHGDPVITSGLHKFEECAAKTFTRQIFSEVKHELEQVVALNVVYCSEDEEQLVMRVNEFCSPNREIEVACDKKNKKFFCQCKLFESRGIPYRHIFGAMRHMHMDHIPETLIMKRWTKDAKSEFITASLGRDSDPNSMEMLRFGSLVATCNSLCQLAKTSVDDYIETRDEVFKLIRNLEARRQERTKNKTCVTGVGDLMIVNTKGAPLKKKFGKKKRNRRCSNCNRTCHYYKRCPRSSKVVSDKDNKDKSDSPADGSLSDDVDRMENELNEDKSSDSSWLNEMVI